MKFEDICIKLKVKGYVMVPGSSYSDKIIFFIRKDIYDLYEKDPDKRGSHYRLATISDFIYNKTKKCWDKNRYDILDSGVTPAERLLYG